MTRSAARALIVNRPQSPELCQDRKLCRAQPARRQKLIVKLRDAPGGLARRETVAVVGPGQAVHGNIGPHLDIRAHTPNLRAYALIRERRRRCNLTGTGKAN
jgi:hypothetical protein